MRKYAIFTFVLISTFGLTGIAYAQSPVMMNEIYSRGTTTDPDWIELYNSSSNPVDISSYKIYDDGGQTGKKAKKGFPAGTSIPAKGFYVVVTDGSKSDDFGLSNNGEEVWLEDGSGTVIDDCVFPALTAAQSYGRIPDGGGWQVLTNITKGSANGTKVDVNEVSSLPNEYNLSQNYPNPFNPSTIIKYSIPEVDPSVARLNAVSVKITVYNLLGSEVATLVNEEKSAGSYEVKFDGTGLASGTYFYTLHAGDFIQTKKMILIK
jgi:Lamin Tail Domain/Secretion system C-terminal sorting domain